MRLVVLAFAGLALFACQNDSSAPTDDSGAGDGAADAATATAPDDLTVPGRARDQSAPPANDLSVVIPADAAAPVDAAVPVDAATPPDAALAAGDMASRFPIQHIIVIVKENHTFDNYFGSFPGADGTNVAHTMNGDVPVGRPPLLMLQDLCHEHSCALTDWNLGKMDGWAQADPQRVPLAYTQYIEADIPNYWQYARNFTLLDHFFSSALAPSFPGHSFALSAQAGWAIDNPAPNPNLQWGCDQTQTLPVLANGGCVQTMVPACFDYPVIPDILPANVTWKFYGSTLPPMNQVWSMFDSVKHLRNSPAWKNNVVDQTQFDTDVANGTLPNIVWLIDQDANSEHPPLSICNGENWTVDRINKVMKSKYWSSTAIIMTYDDFGGWYDHVPPPMQYGCDAQHPYGLGFRLPAIIVSPYVKPKFIMKSVAHQASIPKFIEAIFGLPSLHSMDPAAQDGPGTNDLTEAFDWNQAPNPPLVLPTRLCLGTR